MPARTISGTVVDAAGRPVAQARVHVVKAPGPTPDVARVGIGVAVRTGAPKPDISTPEALKRALLAGR